MADAVPFFAASSHLQALLLCQAASPLRRLGALQPLDRLKHIFRSGAGIDGA